ncbi:MAG: TolC family protein [Gemmatimonadota bacterium]|nr:MAG: TolC family protein [Gemmatimonadota bacterium]
MKGRIQKVLLLICVIMIVGSALHQVSSETLDSLIGEALEKNPEILAANERWQATQARVPQVSALPNPQLMFGIRNAGFDEFTLGEDPMSMVGVTAAQMIPFPGKLSLRGKIVGVETERQKELLNAARFGVISSLKVAYFGLFFVHKSIEVIGKDKDILEKFAQIAEAKYAVGEGIQQDVLKAQVEVSRLIERSTDLEQEKGRLEAEINALLNRPPYEPLGKPDELKQSIFQKGLGELNAMALESSPRLLAAQLAIDRNSSALSLARREYYPDFTLKAGWFNRQDGFRDIWDFNIGVEVPLYFGRKERYGIKEAELNLNSARQNYEATKQDVLFKVRDHYIVAQTADKLIKLYSTGIIPQASLSLESAIAGYEVGKVDFLTLLNNLITLLNYELKYYEELVRFEKALARLEEVVGASIIEY